MNCRDFERVWGERLDARAAPAGDPAGALDAHASACPSCRSLGARFQTLAAAVQALAPPPSPPPGFVERTLAASATAAVPKARPLWTRLVPLAAAAAVALTLAVRDRPAGPAPVPVARAASADPPIDTEHLSEALADATSAGWDLAREATAPAARLGRRLLASAEFPEPARSPSLTDAVPPVADVWRNVGDRVQAGVVPLRGSARHAFGFLIGSTSDAPGPPPREGL